MSGTLATIFSFEASRKWIIRDGLDRDLEQRLGGADRERLGEVSGVSQVRLLGRGGRNASVGPWTSRSEPRTPDEEEAIVPLYEWLFAAPGSGPSVGPSAGRPSRSPGDRLPRRAACSSPRREAERSSASAPPTRTSTPSASAAAPGSRTSPSTPATGAQGVGKALLDAAKDWGRERGATHLELDSAEARTDAHRFYDREGAQNRSICFGWHL